MGTTKQFVEVAICNTSASLLQTSNEVDCEAVHQKITDSVYLLSLSLLF